MISSPPPPSSAVFSSETQNKKPVCIHQQSSPPPVSSALLICPPFNQRNPKPREFWKNRNLVKGIAALTSEFCPQNFFLLSFWFLLYVASLSRLPYILCITLFLVNADIKHDSSPLSHLVPAISQIFVIFIFYLFEFIIRCLFMVVI